jgi:hypothetical protein
MQWYPGKTSAQSRTTQGIQRHTRTAGSADCKSVHLWPRSPAKHHRRVAESADGTAACLRSLSWALRYESRPNVGAVGWDSKSRGHHGASRTGGRRCHGVVTTRRGSGESTGNVEIRILLVTLHLELLRDNKIRPMSDWGSSGRRFKSCQPDHKKPSDLAFSISSDCTCVRRHPKLSQTVGRNAAAVHVRPICATTSPRPARRGD